jgi:[NiFe] hydrogenase assembly HybE family chaperone
MSIESEIRVSLPWDGQRVQRARVRSTRPFAAARIALGRRPADAATLVPTPFAICGHAQAAAAAAALRAAGARPDGMPDITVMNVVLMPRVSAAWQVIGARETRRHVFPGGVFEFIGAREATLGDYQACSLCSPMFEFADQRESRATALAALDALFDPASREAAPVRAAQASSVATAASAETAPMLSKRDFRFGATPRGDRGP